MAKKNLLSGISLEDIDVEATVNTAVETVKKEAPAIKKGFRQVEADVGKAVQGLIDWFAGDDENDESPDVFKKVL